MLASDFLNAPDVGFVVIGRNEGDRLIRCLEAVNSVGGLVVYVDSGSSDASVDAARALGADVVNLDPSRPFSAARARNEGFDRLMATTSPEYVQFIDGDCELRLDWVARAPTFLAATPQAAVACGRLRERYPDASIYNQLCDWEWDLPVGRLEKGCGGIFMIRTAAFADVGGFRTDLIAGEEPELCIRLRARNWEIWRLDAEMALHDAAISRFGQWWKRCRRGGHAYAQRMALHGAGPESQGVRETRHALVWGAVIPLGVLVLSVVMHPGFLLLYLAYALQWVRIAVRFGPRHSRSWIQALFVVLSKFPEALGVLEYGWRWLLRKPARLIEYK